jgi:NAD(P)-dependent dehydrogenase (short-subunit alcohol dehydrogenase family)
MRCTSKGKFMQRIALVTGAAGGLGRTVADKLDKEGWELIVVSRRAARLREVFGERHLQIEADCSTVAGAREVLQVAKDKGMIPTALAHCIGNIRLSALHRMAEGDFNDCLSANLVSAFHTLAAFVGALRDARSEGAAVLVSSIAAQIGTPNHEAIAAAKGGLEGLVRGAAATYAAAGIRINAVAPGIMETPAAAGIMGSAAARDAAARQYPLPGIGTPDELAELMVWLLSDKGARVTGQIWALDGGFTRIRPLVK